MRRSSTSLFRVSQYFRSVSGSLVHSVDQSLEFAVSMSVLFVFLSVPPW